MGEVPSPGLAASLFPRIVVGDELGQIAAGIKQRQKNRRSGQQYQQHFFMLDGGSPFHIFAD